MMDSSRIPACTCTYILTYRVVAVYTVLADSRDSNLASCTTEILLISQGTACFLCTYWGLVDSVKTRAKFDLMFVLNYVNTIY